jgi:eukaryotic-like serine/threonine-protein kinase
MTAPIDVSASVPWPHPLDHAGYVLGGRYRLEERVACGAMGSIWRGRHIQLKSRVAIKFLDVAVARETDMHERFLQEARAAAALHCAHVVRVFDYGRDANIPFIVMEWLEGETLEQRLKRGVLTPRELDKIFRELAIGIRQAHATGVVHRDLKPSNVFIAREGDEDITKLIDFGIVKVDEARLGFTPRANTRAGTVIGTPEYMSPEQLRAGEELDPSVDLWALAIVAFECLTGRLPFSGNSMPDLIVQICTEEAAAPSSFAAVPAGFDRWFAKATQKEVGRRFASAEAMAEALSSILRAAPDASPQRQALNSCEPVHTPPLNVPAGLARLGAQLARWLGSALPQRQRLALLFPAAVGLLGIALVGIAIALRPARTERLTVAPLQVPPMPAREAPALAAPNMSSLSPAPTPAQAASADDSASASAPTPPKVDLRAETSRAPSSRPAEAKPIRKPRSASAQRAASASPALVNRTGAGEPAKSTLEQRPPAPAPSSSTHGGQTASAASAAGLDVSSADADALFAERR